MAGQIWSYGAVQPLEQESYQKELLGGHNYRNKLVEIERRRREVVDKLILQMYPNLANAKDVMAAAGKAVGDARDKIAQANIAARDRTQTSKDKSDIARLRETYLAAKNDYYKQRDASFEKQKKMEEAKLDAEEPELTALRTKMQEGRKEIVDAKKAKLSATHIDELQKKQKLLNKAFGKMRRQIIERMIRTLGEEAAKAKIPLQMADYQAGEAAKVAYNEAACSWGTKGMVLKSAEKFGIGSPPEFRRNDGEGRVGVQIQKSRSVNGKDQLGMDAATLLACTNSQLRLEIVEQSNKHSAKAILWMRIGSDGKSPIWIHIPMTYHRPVPPEASIKSCWLLRERVGTTYRYAVQFQLTGKDSIFAKETVSNGIVGVNIGWRKIPAGVRALYWYGTGGNPAFAFLTPKADESIADRNLREALSAMVHLHKNDGSEGEFIIPHEMIRRWIKADELKSICQRLFNEIVSKIADWKDQNESILPEWFKEHFKTLRQWKSQNKLLWEVEFWRKNRFTGDETIFQELDGPMVEIYRQGKNPHKAKTGWLHKHRHLFNWHINNVDGAERWRTHVYRLFAAELRKAFGVIHTSNAKYDEMRRNATIEDRRHEDEFVGKYMNIVSAGKLDTILTAGRSFKEVETEGITMVCHVCHEVSGETQPKRLLHRCEDCGAAWDQDRNAAINLYNGGVDVSKVRTAIANDPNRKIRKMHPRERKLGEVQVQLIKLSERTTK